MYAANVFELYNKQEESSCFSTHRLALSMLIKIVKSLGCAYGCGEGHRGLSGDRLRMQVRIVFPVVTFPTIQQNIDIIIILL